MYPPVARPHASQGQLGLASLLMAAGFALGMIDVALAFLGGVLIGLALGYWILPLVVDHLDSAEWRDRWRRHRGG